VRPFLRKTLHKRGLKVYALSSNPVPQKKKKKKKEREKERKREKVLFEARHLSSGFEVSLDK
jgi:hypothetical protein